MTGVQTCALPIYENIRLGSIVYQDTRPSVAFYSPGGTWNILIELNETSPEVLSEIETSFKNLFPQRNVNIKVMQNDLFDIYSVLRNFRDAVLIGSIVILLISLIGLIGYLNDELNRRRKEIAIRKINGGTLKDILQIFMRDILWIALPAISLG